MKVLLILIVVCYVVSQVESQDDSTKHQKEERNGNQLTNKPEQKHIIWTLMKKIRRLSKSVKEMKAELSNRDDSIEVALAELSQKMDIKDDSIKAEVAQMRELMNIKVDSIETDVNALSNKIDTNIDAIKAELIEKMDNKDDSIEAEIIEKMDIKDDSIKADVTALGNKMDTKVDSLEADVNALSNKIEEDGAKEAICGYQDKVNNTNQTITFDTVHVERNDNGGSLNKESGIFTAGRAGVYAVSLSATTGETKFTSALSVRLRTSSGRYQKEDALLGSYTYYGGDFDAATLSASRYMYLDENEEIFLEYHCKKNKHCLMAHLKFCISYYSARAKKD